jgi:polysaccharide export outer membrane protein
VQIPAQAVDQTGAIWVPYCGRIQAAGRTPAEIAATVEAGLRGNAIEPQVIVSIVQNQSNLVTIAGEVGQGMRFPLRLTGDRVLDALAMAGGPRGPSHETFVRLMRGTSSASMLLQRIVADPRENIYLRPGDDLFVYRSPLTFTVFGATGRNGQIPFEASQLSLAEALAKAGGLLDHRADAKGVWVFRYEEPEFYGLLRPSREPPPAKDGRVPVVFHIDLTSANAYSLAQAFPIRDKDLVFVSNAPIVDFQKVLGIIGSAFGASGAQSAINATR